MTTIRLTLALLAIAVAMPLSLAQSTPPGTLDEATRLEQEYMARRQVWIELRKAELEKAKAAKDKKDRDKILRKLADDEQVLKAAASALSKQVEDARKAKRPANPPAPRG